MIAHSNQTLRVGVSRTRSVRLPLLGSNQDSPDPESPVSSRFGRASGETDPNRPRFARGSHGNTHRISDRVQSAALWLLLLAVVVFAAGCEVDRDAAVKVPQKSNIVLLLDDTARGIACYRSLSSSGLACAAYRRLPHVRIDTGSLRGAR